MARNRWGQDVPEPKVHDSGEPYKDSGLVDAHGRKLVREKRIGFTVPKEEATNHET